MSSRCDRLLVTNSSVNTKVCYIDRDALGSQGMDEKANEHSNNNVNTKV